MLSSLQSPSVFFSFLTLLRLSMAKSKFFFGKCHIELENIWVTFKYLLILISKISPQWWENRLYDFNAFILTMKFLHLVLCSWICSSVSWFTVYRNLNRIYILLLCEMVEILIMLNWFIVLFGSTNILLLFCLLILLIFESLLLKLQLRVLST